MKALRTLAFAAATLLAACGGGDDEIKRHQCPIEPTQAYSCYMTINVKAGQLVSFVVDGDVAGANFSRRIFSRVQDTTPSFIDLNVAGRWSITYSFQATETGPIKIGFATEPTSGTSTVADIGITVKE